MFVWFALLLTIMLGVAAFAVDLGHAYLVGQQAQDAADAAALSASSYLPDNCVNADPHAQSITALNGFPNGGVNTVVAVNGAAGTGCDNDQSLSPNQIRVDVKTKVNTWFARALGIDTLTVSRSSTAEYDPPVQLGSPHSYFGEAPGCNSCAEQPNIWASAAGQDNRKVDGNAIFERWCQGTSADNCAGNGLSNTDQDKTGMLFEISNPTGSPLNIELYDPGFVDAGLPCTDGSPYPTCTGDEALSQATAGAPLTKTIYTLYPLDNLNNPLGNPPLCHATYPGHTLAQVASANDTTSRSYHKWANLSADAGGCGALSGSSYVLQVQTGDDQGDQPEAGVNNFSVAACTGCASNQPSDDPNVDVSAITKMSLFTNATPATANPLFYLARVPSWAHGQFLTLSFFDVGDISNAAGQPVAGALRVLAVDATHGAGGSKVGEFSSCTFSHPESRGNNASDYITGQPTPWSGTATDTEWATNPTSLTSLGGTGCTAQVHLNPATNASYWNGKWVTWKIPIPNDYTCNDRDLTKCWLQIQYQYSGAQFHDATTWTASLSGNPVRLTK